MSRPVAGVLSDLESVLIDAEAIRQRVQALAAEIQADFGPGELSVVALMDGSLFFVADLLRHLDLPLHLHTLTVSSYHGGTSSSGRVNMAESLPFSLKTKRVLLIDDILDTGLTLSSVQQRLLKDCQPEIMRTAVLLRKQRPREQDASAEYVGFDIADEFVVGYGMDYQGRYRNVPYIGILNPSKL